MAASAIYQRTDAGCMEIQLKKQGLTQSERLILIVVDGRASLLELSEKLKGLDSSRISRAIDKLAGKQLIYEVLLPSPATKIDVVDAVQIDRFLQQDPLDPVTIISFDADYDYEVLGQQNVVSAFLPPVHLGDSLLGSAALNIEKVNSEALHITRASVALGGVDFYVPLVKVIPASAGAMYQHSNLPSQSASGIFPAHRGGGYLSSYRGRLLHLLWLAFLGVGFFMVSLSVWGGISRYLGFT